jgi:hypothetical protein
MEMGERMAFPDGGEPVSDAALIENFHGSHVQTAGAHSGEVLAFPPFDDGDIDPGEGEFAGEHQSRRSSAHDDDLVVPFPDRPPHGLSVVRLRLTHVFPLPLLSCGKLRETKFSAILDLEFVCTISATAGDAPN